jgi:hypothetical protein
VLAVPLAVAPWEPRSVELSAPAAWTFLVAGGVVAATLVLLLRRVPATQVAGATGAVQALAPAAVALGVVDLVLRLDPQLWAYVLTAALAAAVAGAAAWWVRDDRVAGWIGSCATAYLVLVTLDAAEADDLVLALCLTVLALALGAVHALRERDGAAVAAGVALALTTAAGGAALVAWGERFGTDPSSVAVALAGYAGLGGALAAVATRLPSSRMSLELSALAVGTAAVLHPDDLHASAMALTVVGSAICLVAVTNRDREAAGWLGAAVLASATLLRVALDVQAPELYTLPAAAVLIAFGIHRMLDDDDANSFTMLGSGLSLALLPSLLLALEEPVSLRGALVGAAGVVVLAIGVLQRWGAPFALGAVTIGLLAVRHLEPYADAVPRWISLGGVGLALLLAGVTWESRRRNLRTASRYLAALR